MFLRDRLFGIRAVQWEGVPVSDKGTLNFAGPNVAVTYDTPTNRITVSIGSDYNSLNVDELGAVDLTVSGFIDLDPVTAPPAPSAGRFRIYVDTNDGKLKAKSSGGAVTVLAS